MGGAPISVRDSAQPNHDLSAIGFESASGILRGNGKVAISHPDLDLSAIGFESERLVRGSKSVAFDLNNSHLKLDLHAARLHDLPSAPMESSVRIPTWEPTCCPPILATCPVGQQRNTIYSEASSRPSLKANEPPPTSVGHVHRSSNSGGGPSPPHNSRSTTIGGKT